MRLLSEFQQWLPIIKDQLIIFLQTFEIARIASAPLAFAPFHLFFYNNCISAQRFETLLYYFDLVFSINSIDDLNGSSQWTTWLYRTCLQPP